MPRRSNLYGIRLGMYEASFETRLIEAPPTAGGEVHVAENATPGNRSSGTPATTNKPPPFVPPSQDLLPVESVAANERNPVDCVREALALAVSPDSSRFATLALRRHVGRNDETEIVLWSTQELQPLRTASSLPAEFRDIEFSPDGTQLMCAGRVHVWFWDLKSGAHTVGLHAGYARPISAERVFFCPNGRQIVAKGVADGPVRLWDFATGNGIVVETLANIGGFLPEGSLVGVAASIPRKLVAWNLEDHSYRTLCEPLAGVPVALSPYGDRLVTEERVALLGGNCKDVRHVRLWDLKSAREIPIGGPQPQAVEPFYSRRLNDHMALGVSIQWDGRNIRFAPRYELTPRREQAQRPRDWAAHNLASSCRAAMIAYGHGKVTLRKDGGEEVTVPVEQLTAMDRRFVQEFADSLGESVEP
jgi:WD40 repeat protein